MTKVKKTPEEVAEDEAIEAHQLVIDALRDVEQAKADLQQTRDDIVAGSPVSASDLAAATAGVERAELLVERARDEAAVDLARRGRAERIAETIRTEVRSDTVFADALQFEQDLCRSIRIMWSVAAAQSERVEQMSQQIRALKDPGSDGLAVDPWNPKQMVRTSDAVLVATPPLGVIASALLTAIESKGAVESAYPELIATLRAHAAEWEAAKALQRSAHQPIQDQQERAAAAEERRRAYNRQAAEAARANLAPAQEG